MKALVKKYAEEGIWLEDVPKPECGHADVLIKVKKTAICGTDVHIYNWDDWARKTIKVPLVTGHEFVGEIVELGEDVTGFALGDRVSAEGHIVCGQCRNCRGGRQHLCPNTKGTGVNINGAFAEYIVMPATNVYKMDDAISDNIASILDPIGNATHVALSFDCIGEDILITGAGPVGIISAAIAKFIGARHIVITDVNPYRLELAKKMGATRTVDVTQETIPDVIKELGMKEGFDVGFEMSGHPDGLNAIVDNLVCGGYGVLLGIPPDHTTINWNNVIFKGLFLKGIYGREMYETWYKMLSMIQTGLDLTPIITHEFSINEFQQGFDVMRSGRSGKVILNW